MKRVFVRRLMAVLAGLAFMTAAHVCYASDPFTKLGRGVANVLTGWVEIPKNVYNTSRDENAFTGMTLGLARGIGLTIVRTGAGLFEAATFPFPVPENYKPVLEPEYVF